MKSPDVFYDVNKRSIPNIKRRNSLTCDDECYCFLGLYALSPNKDEEWKKSLKSFLFCCCRHNG
ncbi:CLUMA_CG021116, isoform A [Clunio marinus]|uniref:CLUMA_CG021116, isoform A n=1 Tax=Clunio marinus TaxID=568069 RepID=A0A1J1J7A7_9DIPT|nr:CLUMA_CG021116, isoform A [Clunio marinus]